MTTPTDQEKIDQVKEMERAAMTPERQQILRQCVRQNNNPITQK
jgi:hypothetical protein